MFEDFSITINLLIFAALAGFIWIAGTRLSYFIDAIAEHTKIARAFLGLVLLATATELPEMVTTTTAAYSGNGSLALNNMFGGMMLQLAVLAIADIFVKNRPLSSMPQKPAVAVAGLLCVLPLSFLLMMHVTGDMAVFAHLGIGSIMVTGLYIVSMFILRRVQDRSIWSPVDLPEDQIAEQKRKNRYDSLSLNKLIAFSAVCAAVILACGILVVRLADTLAVQTGLGASFIGISLLAMTTSLPELSTSIAAVRVRAYTMAISNIFGSNMIMTFLVFPVDLFFLKGPVLNEINSSAAFALAAGIFMTSIYCVGLLIRPKTKILGMGMDSLLVLVGYIVSLSVLYHLG